MQLIRVNGVEIPPEKIYQEMQMFPSASREEAEKAAGRALVISELLKQRARLLSLEAEDDDGLMEQLLALEVNRTDPSDEEIQRYYLNHTDEFSSSPLAEVSHILLGVAPDDFKGRDDKRREATALIERLRQEPDQFARLAAKFSDCPSRETQGSLGQISRGQTVPEFEKAIFRATQGLMSEPLESRYGLHVVWIQRLVPGKVLPFEVVSERVRDYLQERAERHAIADYLYRLADEATLEGIDLQHEPLIQ